MPTSCGERARTPAWLGVSGLTAGYDASPIVRSVEFTVGRGEVVALVGPNGAGKSTLLKTIAGVLTPTAGTVTLNGHDITGASPDELARRGLGYVPQVADVFTTLTTRENLEMGGYLLPRRQVRSRLDEVLSLFPPLARLLRSSAGALSGGERKLLGIARAMMLDPDIMMLDEPTAGLSEMLANSLLEQHIRRLADGGKAVVIVEQKALAALDAADWACVLVSGETRLQGWADEVRRRPEFEAVFLGAEV